jgi:signal transduction histidine kinase
VSRRLLATYVTLTIAVLAALEIPLGIQYGRSERRDLTNRIARDALIMATFAEDPLERGVKTAPQLLTSAAKRYQKSPGGRVVVVDRQGISLVDTQEPIGRQMRTASRPEIAKALIGNVTSGTRHSRTLGADLIYVAVPIASAGHVRGAVRITYPTSTLDSRVNRYWLLLAAIGGVVLAAATIVGLRLARALSRPLSALEVAAGAVGAGDLTVRAPAQSGPPEVRAVAAQFNETVERLDALLHSQQEFIADASHQLRTPLTALRLRLENLDRDIGASSRRDLDAALAEVERLARLVEGLLVLARADATKAAPEPVELAAVAGARVDHWSMAAAARGVALFVDVPPGLKGLATPGSLEQILDNLLSNALAVSPSGSTIRIEGRSAPGSVELQVSDEGPGMSAEERARAFDRFWRAGPPGTGTGLGLPVVHRLVSADGGTIELREAAGRGLEAVVTLQAVPQVPANPNARLARA